MSESIQPSVIPVALPPDLFLDHRLGDNEILAAFCRICASAVKARTWPIYTFGPIQTKTLTGFGRVDRGRETLRSLEVLGLVEIEEGANQSLTLKILAE